MSKLFWRANDAQHPDTITSLRVRHRGSLRKPGRELFFASGFEHAAMTDPEGGGMVFMSATVHVGRDALFAAIAEVETFALWLEKRLLDARYPVRTPLAE